jgi:hypothetical protein
MMNFIKNLAPTTTTTKSIQTEMKMKRWVTDRKRMITDLSMN